MTTDDKPIIDPTDISIPPVITTKVRNRAIMLILTKSLILYRSTFTLRKRGLIIPNITISSNNNKN